MCRQENDHEEQYNRTTVPLTTDYTANHGLLFLLCVSEYTCYAWIQCTGGTNWGLYWVLRWSVLCEDASDRDDTNSFVLNFVYYTIKKKSL